MTRTQRFSSVLVAIASGLTASAELKLAGPFQDHAVLQRSIPVPIWGTSNPHASVTVSFLGQEVTAVADGEGRWRTVLPPLATASEGGDMVVTAGADKVSLHDMLVGEVWLCSGQSNMEWDVARAADAAKEIAEAKHPLIRVLKVGLASSMPPAPAMAEGTWKVCSPATAGAFTAVGYHFARELQQVLHVPIGIIDSTWGGTPIEAWLSEEALLSDPALKVIFERWGDLIATFPQRRATAQEKYRAWQRAKTDAESRGQLFDQPPPADFWSLENRVRPMGLYGGMIAPLIPYAIRGTAWYQGEQNAGQKHYQASLAALIADWRLKWGEGEFPFLVVQLPNYASGNPAGEAWPRTREAQARVAATLPNVSLAVTIDQGERDSVHPLHKREVGRRLALLTLNKTYGRDIIAEGPVFRKAQFNGSHVDVQLDRAEGLHATSERVSGFELAGSDRKFAPAEAKLTGDGLTVTSPDVSVPIAVRYAWRNAPDTNLYNAAALPLAPFRSDNW